MSEITIKNQCFGLEDEMTGITREEAAKALAEHFGTQARYTGGGYGKWTVKDQEGKTWTLMSDSSITTERKVNGKYEYTSNSSYEVEMVTPKLTFEEIPKLQEAIRTLRRTGAKVNDSCGLHIHIDAANHNRQSLKNLMSIMFSKEDILFKALQVNEGRARDYCQKVREPMLTKARKLSADETKDLTRLESIWYEGNNGSYEHYNWTRYYALNLHSVFYRGTVEFRCFNATLHAGIVKAYVHLTIPATKSKYTATPLSCKKKRKVAAYARVSTDHEEQQSSYEAQVDYYTTYIQGRDDWEFVSVYADEGITGCNTKKRDGFNSMVEDALAGKIDLIITKSVSRFARNTVDSLTTIRKLKEHGTECYFEKENIWTFDGKGELLLTIMSSLAQEESRSISENCTWGQRKRFQDGKVTVPFGRFLGYDRGEDGNLVLNEDEAQIIRRIYGLFLQGRSPYAIAKVLTSEGIPTPGKKKTWSASTVKSILTNEKYKGDALLQKVYTEDFLTKKKIKNDGQVPQYYVENNHPAIIEPGVFDRVQKLMAVRHPGQNRNSSISPFSSRIKCGECGSWYGSKVWHSNDKYRKVIWQCNHKFDGDCKCGTPHITEDEIRSLFIKAINILITEKDALIEDFEAIKDTVFDTSALVQERTDLQVDMNTVAGLIEECIAENARIAQDQGEYQKRYDIGKP